MCAPIGALDYRARADSDNQLSGNFSMFVDVFWPKSVCARRCAIVTIVAGFYLPPDRAKRQPHSSARFGRRWLQPMMNVELFAIGYWIGVDLGEWLSHSFRLRRLFSGGKSFGRAANAN